LENGQRARRGAHGDQVVMTNRPRPSGPQAL